MLVEQGRLAQEQAGREMGLSSRQVRRVLKRYRESSRCLDSLDYQRQHPSWNATRAGKQPSRPLGADQGPSGGVGPLLCPVL